MLRISLARRLLLVVLVVVADADCDDDDASAVEAAARRARRAATAIDRRERETLVRRAPGRCADRLTENVGGVGERRFTNARRVDDGVEVSAVACREHHVGKLRAVAVERARKRARRVAVLANAADDAQLQRQSRS